MNGDLRAVLEELHHALDADEVVALKGVDDFADVIPHLGVKVASAVGQGQRQIGLTRFLLPDFLLLHEKYAQDGLIRRELAHVRSFHDVTASAVSGIAKCLCFVLTFRGWEPCPSGGACAAWPPPVLWSLSPA